MRKYSAPLKKEPQLEQIIKEEVNDDALGQQSRLSFESNLIEELKKVPKEQELSFSIFQTLGLILKKQPEFQFTNIQNLSLDENLWQKIKLLI